MLISVFKSNQTIVNGLTALLFAFFCTLTFFFGAGLNPNITTGFRFLDFILLFFLVTGQAIYLNYIVNNYKLTRVDSHLTSLVFVLLNSVFLWFFELNWAVIANTFVVMALHQLFRLYGTKNHFSIIFNTGLLIGMAGMIYFPMALYMLVFCMFLIYTTTPTWRDFVIAFIGFFVPTAYYIIYQIIVKTGLIINYNTDVQHLFAVSWETLAPVHQLQLLGWAIVFVFALIYLLATIGSSVIKKRKLLMMTLLMLVVGLNSLWLNQYDFSATLLIISIPISIIMAIFFQNIKKIWLAEIIFLCLLIVLILGY